MVTISKHPVAESLLEDLLYTFDELYVGFDRCLKETGEEAATVNCQFTRDQINELRCAIRFALDVKAKTQVLATKPYTKGPSLWVARKPYPHER